MRAWTAGLGLTAGLIGAGGVVLAAAGAHLTSGQSIATAANFCLFHAAALVGLCALLVARPAKLLVAAATLLALGTLLFSGDLALRGLAGIVVWHAAAPTGGIVLIAGWLLVAGAIAKAMGGSGTPGV